MITAVITGGNPDEVIDNYKERGGGARQRGRRRSYNSATTRALLPSSLYTPDPCTSAMRLRGLWAL